MAELYEKEGPTDKPNKKESSWDADASNIKRHIIPLLGSKKLHSLTQADIAKFQRDVIEGKTACDERTKLRGRAIAMLQFAVNRGLLQVNPAKGVKFVKRERKERFLSEREAGLLLDNLKAMEETHAINQRHANIIRLLLLTGARKTEILSLKWGYVDFERKCLKLPDSKTGAKTIRLSAPALLIFSGIRENEPDRTDGDWVFPARNGKTYVQGLRKSFVSLRNRCGLPDVRIHDLRHTFASLAIANGASLYLIGKTLGHKQTRTTEIYAHLSDNPLQSLVEDLGRKLGQSFSRVGENVVLYSERQKAI